MEINKRYTFWSSIEYLKKHIFLSSLKASLITEREFRIKTERQDFPKRPELKNYAKAYEEVCKTEDEFNCWARYMSYIRLV